MEQNRLTGTSLSTRTLFQLKCNGSLYFAEVKCELIIPYIPRANPSFPMRLEVVSVAAVAAVAATAAYIRRLRAELAAAKRDNDEFVAAALRGKLAQQQQQPPPQQAPPQQVIEQMSHEHF